MRQILWGLFKKIVVADNLAGPVDVVFSSPETMTSGTLWIGAFFFAMQIYCDFSGYSDMALGLGRLFGFELMQNFRTPYFAVTLPEFWQRWHISLSTWFRDYVFIPLGGSRVSTARWCFNILVTFGAVSVAVAWAMAQGALQHSHADIAVAITGIAGPAGGSEKKPVGTVVFARAVRGDDPDRVVADVRNFGDLGRSEIRRQAALVALELLMPVAE
jgi:hypothetical protein